jgi:hypothetical protein
MLGESALILNASVKFRSQAFHQEPTKSNPDVAQDGFKSALSVPELGPIRRIECRMHGLPKDI